MAGKATACSNSIPHGHPICSTLPAWASRGQPRCLAPCHPGGRPERSSWILALTWPSPGCSAQPGWGREAVNETDNLTQRNKFFKKKNEGLKDFISFHPKVLSPCLGEPQKWVLRCSVLNHCLGPLHPTAQCLNEPTSPSHPASC